MTTLLLWVLYFASSPFVCTLPSVIIKLLNTGPHPLKVKPTTEHFCARLLIGFLYAGKLVVYTKTGTVQLLS